MTTGGGGILPLCVVTQPQLDAELAKAFPTRPEMRYVAKKRRPSKTELEFVIVAACMLVPAEYWIVRTILAL